MLVQGDEGRRKRVLSLAGEEAGDAKRLKAGHDSSPAGGSPRIHRPVDPAILANFDFSSLPNDVLAEIVVESLKLITEEQLDAAIEASTGLSAQSHIDCELGVERFKANYGQNFSSPSRG